MCGAELLQGQLVVALTISHQGQSLTGKIDPRSLPCSPLGMSQGPLGVGLLQRIGGQNVQTNVLSMLLAQSAQAQAIILGEHGPFQAFGHLGLARPTIRVGILRGVGDGSVRVATTAVIAILAVTLIGPASVVMATVVVTMLALVPVAMGTVAPIAALTMVVMRTVTIRALAIGTVPT